MTAPDLKHAMLNPTSNILVAAQKAYAKSVITSHKEGHMPLIGKLSAIEPAHMRVALIAAIEAASEVGE